MSHTFARVFAGLLMAAAVSFPGQSSAQEAVLPTVAPATSPVVPAPETSAPSASAFDAAGTSAPVAEAVDHTTPEWGYTALAEQLDPGSALRVTEKPSPVSLDGETIPLRTMREMGGGVLVPDGQGGLIWMEGVRPKPEAAHSAARELKLKVREMADQLLAKLDRRALQGVVALPVSLVNQDDFSESSSFGRYVAEALFYEFNQRGFPVREYRSSGELILRAGEGEFLFSRNQQRIYNESPLSLYVAGTYYYDRENIFVNLRMLRAADGMVLRTAQVVFPQTGVSRRMIANTGRRLEETYVSMQDYQTFTRATDLTALDLGEDFH